MDELLSYVKTNGNAIYICNAEPTTYAEATSTYAIGNKTSPASGAIGNGTPNGREFQYTAISDGTVTSNDTATHFAVVDTVGSELLVVQELASSLAVVTSLDFALTAFKIKVSQPA